MDDLPLELKQRVCSYLTTRDLKSLRLISKSQSAGTDHYLLPRIFLSESPDSFQDIQGITDHPDLRRSVTTLVVDTCCRPVHAKYEQWARLYADNDSESDKTLTRAERGTRREKNQ